LYKALEYFDAFIIGLTATPSMQTLGQTFGYFQQNLVSVGKLSFKGSQRLSGLPPAMSV
jgi:type I site-specific restriction endonuclease